MKQTIQTILLAAVLFTGHTTSAIAADWHEYQKQGLGGLRAGYSSYAFNKFGQAWLAVNDPTYKDPAYKEIRQNLISSLRDGQANEYAEFDDKTITAHVLRNQKLDYTNWTVSINKDRDLVFDAPRNVYVVGNQICGNNAQEVLKLSPQEQKLRAAGVQQIVKQQQTLGEQLPVKLSPQDIRYSDALASAGPIEIGQKKAVTFNLNPYLPQPLRLTTDY